MASLYIAYIVIRCSIRPEDGARIPPSPDDPALLEKLAISFKALVPPVLLIFAVLGTIMFGWAAPTEAAGVGAFGAILLTIIYGQFNWKVLQEALTKTVKVTCMIMLILLAGSMFSGVFIASGGVILVQDIIQGSQLPNWATLAVFLAISFIAGFVLEWISILLIFIPVFVPVVKAMGYDPVWFCVLFLIIIQTSYLTPPMAPAIFYLRGISPPEITLQHMFRGMIPFIVLQIITLVIVMMFPQIVLWLPDQLLGFN